MAKTDHKYAQWQLRKALRRLRELAELMEGTPYVYTPELSRVAAELKTNVQNALEALD